MNWWSDLTWTCHICGEERPDAKISVFKKSTNTGTGIPVQENIRYCNDRKSCIDGAPKFSHLTKKAPS